MMTGKWRPGTTDPRRIFGGGGQYFVYVSDHPKEERIVVLTEDYCDEHGDFIPPEMVPWNGVETCPGIFIEAPDE